MRTINKIIIHHSASSFGCQRLIDEWHKERGWDGCGYHYIIQNGYPYSINEKIDSLIGQIEQGRNIEKTGAHAKGFNSTSIGICLIHNDGTYDSRMLVSLSRLVRELTQRFNIDTNSVVGHYELNTNKSLCPSIDMEWFRKSLNRYIDKQANRTFRRI